MNFLLEQGELSGSMSPVQLYDTWVLAGRSRESTRVGTGIDWILTTDGTGQDMDVTDASVVGNAAQASDHIPITGDAVLRRESDRKPISGETTRA